MKLVYLYAPIRRKNVGLHNKRWEGRGSILLNLLAPEFWISSVIHFELKGKCRDVWHRIERSFRTIVLQKPEIERTYAVAEVLWVYQPKPPGWRFSVYMCYLGADCLRLAARCGMQVVTRRTQWSTFTDLDFNMSAYLCKSIHRQQCLWGK
jgi:hypothetical protein